MYHCGTPTSITDLEQVIECEANCTRPLSISSGIQLWRFEAPKCVPPAKTGGWLSSDCHTALKPLLLLTHPLLKSESATPLDMALPLSSGLVGGPLDAICVIVLRWALDRVLDVQPLSLTFNASLSDSINLDIMSGMRLFQKLSAGGR